MIRDAFGLDRDDFGRLLGYTGSRKNVKSSIARMEMNRKEIPPIAARLAWLLLECWKKDGLPEFPPSCDSEPEWRAHPVDKPEEICDGR